MYLSIKDAAQSIGVAEETVRRWIRDGKFPAEDMGGRNGYRIKEADWEEFINTRTATSSAFGANTYNKGPSLNLSLLGSLGAAGISAIYSAVTKFKDGKENSSEFRENKLKMEARKFEIQQEFIAIDADFERYKIAYEAKKKSLELELVEIDKVLKDHF